MSGLLKKIAGIGGFGIAGLAASHKLGGVARSGALGIGGAILAGKGHKDAGAAPGMPQFGDFNGDAVGYLNAIQQWSQGQLAALQGQQGGDQGAVPPQGVM